MNVRPIIFSAPMVRALLDGRKTMTRRVLNPQPPHGWRYVGLYAPGLTAVFDSDGSGPPDWTQRLRYMPRDLLWVRESCHNWTAGDVWRSRWLRDADDSECTTFSQRTGPGKRAGFHMPRRDSRLTLEVTGVKVERLQEISDADCIAEGPFIANEPSQIDGGAMVWPDPSKPYATATPRAWYRELWGFLHGTTSWDENPHVVCISFTHRLANIDDVLKSKVAA